MDDRAVHLLEQQGSRQLEARGDSLALGGLLHRPHPLRREPVLDAERAKPGLEQEPVLRDPIEYLNRGYRPIHPICSSNLVPPTLSSYRFRGGDIR